MTDCNAARSVVGQRTDRRDRDHCAALRSDHRKGRTRLKRKRDILSRAYQTTADDIVGKLTIASLDAEMRAKEQQSFLSGVAASFVCGLFLVPTLKKGRQRHRGYQDQSAVVRVGAKRARQGHRSRHPAGACKLSFLITMRAVGGPVSRGRWEAGDGPRHAPDEVLAKL